MKSENDLACFGIHIHNNLVEQRSEDAFPQTNILLRTASHCLQFASQILKRFPCGRGGNIPLTMDVLLDSKFGL